MAIPESQLETWSHQGAVTTSKITADSIKNTLNNYKDWPTDIDHKIYLQGSYKNDTNIRGDSDVDVIVQLNSTLSSNLSDEQKKILGFVPASYHWPDFRASVLKALNEYYGNNNVKEGNKSIKLRANGNRLPADIVVCLQYRKYYELAIKSFKVGVCFWTQNDSNQIINYPKIHYENGVNKHQNTNGWYKPMVRVIKNIRTLLVDQQCIANDLAPSYFIECLLFNVPNNQYGNSYQDSFCNIMNWLNKSDFRDFDYQHGQGRLFGTSNEQWIYNKANDFVKVCISLWNEW